MKALISPLAVAPMIDWTYSHFRVFMRLLAPYALLYTDMQTVGAIKNKPERALGFNAMESPVALQLGGSDPKALAECAKLAEEKRVAEINLNLGCPSDKVKAGRFGACLMAEPGLVAECISTMKRAVSIPVSAKTRIGIDNDDSYEFFSQFIHCLVDAGCDKLIVHARKAWLHGLNPKQNRTIPPVHYDFVYRIKKELAHLPIIINGNINTLLGIQSHMQQVDGVMVGRLVCQNPFALAALHQYFYPQTVTLTRYEALAEYFFYMQEQVARGANVNLLLKPIFNLAHGLSNAKAWKEQLICMQQGKNMANFSAVLQILKEKEVETKQAPFAI